MANKALFGSVGEREARAADTLNAAGGRAYRQAPEHKLAQLAATGTLSSTFYADGQTQLDEVLALASQVTPAYLAKAAIYARREGHMKDMPALLLACLSVLDPVVFARAFPRVIDNGRMLRTFVQIMRSGAVARKSLGSRPKAMIEAWLANASDAQIIAASVGQSPSLADVIRMVHPRPATAGRKALYAYLIGKPYDVDALPEALRAYEAFKRDPSREVPDVPFQMLAALPLSAKQWAQIGAKGGWQMLRMNLNTFARHGAFGEPGFERTVMKRLTNADEIAAARVMPYQLLAASLAAGPGVPRNVKTALEAALHLSLANVPAIAGNVVVAPDVSGSMSSPVTGHRKGATSAVRCIDVAALVAAAMLRTNKKARILPFECDVVDVHLNPRDSVMENARKLAAIGGGGTNCAAPLEKLNRERAPVDLFVFVSDNQSWMGSNRGQSTAVMDAWTQIKARNPRAKLVCIDIQPYGSTQAYERPDILNAGGFSDAVFGVMARFANGTMGPQHWTGEIDKITL